MLDTLTTKATPSLFYRLFEGVPTSTAVGIGVGAIAGPAGAATVGTLSGVGRIAGNAIKLGSKRYICDALPKRYQEWANTLTEKAIDTGVLALSGGLLNPAQGALTHFFNAVVGQIGGKLGSEVADKGCDYLGVKQDSLIRKGSKLALSTAGAFAAVKTTNYVVNGGEIQAKPDSDTHDNNLRTENKMGGGSSNETSQTQAEHTGTPNMPTGYPEMDCADNIKCYMVNQGGMHYYIPIVPEQNGVASVVRFDPQFGAECFPAVECGHNQQTGYYSMQLHLCLAQRYQIVTCRQQSQFGIFLDTAAPFHPREIDGKSLTFCRSLLDSCQPLITDPESNTSPHTTELT